MFRTPMTLKAYIPEDAEWFLADLVVAISIEGVRSTLVHINTVLIHASRPNEALAKAKALGRQEQMQYRNIDGQRVRFRFLGLRDLYVVHDRLEHGAELSWVQRRTRTLQGARQLVRPKGELGAFAPRQPHRGASYMDGDLDRELNARLPETRRRRRAKRR